MRAVSSPASSACRAPVWAPSRPAFGCCSTHSQRGPTSLLLSHERCTPARGNVLVRAAETVTISTQDCPHVSAGEPSVVPTQAQSSDKFVWTQHWYPVMCMVDLDPKIPRHVDLLGKSLVVWADSQGQWHCLEDLCPHRLAPLSEGRVEKDTLMCSYHGWTFSGQGACTNIPQIPPGPALGKACQDRKACVHSYPTSVAHGLLWVWPETGADATQQAARQTPGEVLVTKDRTPWFRRELPNRAVTQLENLLDPSHVIFAHHGVQGNRYDTPMAIMWSEMFFPKPVEMMGFSASTAIARPNGKGGEASFNFTPPCNVTHILTPKNMDPIILLQLMIVPNKPGFCTLYSNGPRDLPFVPTPLRSLVRWSSRTLWAAAMSHLSVVNSVLDGDLYLLHLAVRRAGTCRRS